MPYSLPSSAKPFTLNISEADFSEFKQLLQVSKIGPLIYESNQEDGRYGVSRQWLANAKEYWLNKYDWRAEEKHINSFPNYTMTIEDLTIHFVGLFSEKKDAVPIVFMHGWPGSFIEFLPVAELIRKKYTPASQPYHIIIASLPGYTLSSSGPLDKDWTLQDTARIINTLMNNLGFEKYIAQGGDVGSFVSTILSATYDSCVGIHVNFLSTPLPSSTDSLSALEQKALARAATFRETGFAYGQEHATRPSTIGLVLSTNPLALLAWIAEKFLEWTDDSPPLSTILTNVSLYWFTSSFPRSIYPYRQLLLGNRPEPPYLSKPLGFSFFPLELFPGVRSEVEKRGNVVFYRGHERGGHFAALERPEWVLGDVEEFVAVAWEK
ncbi:epoxide hydrolase-like protein [Lojkania enalia]|uniref:Epoxide hydrolase-like protein n=1 Tax=Lojkania enalia TaxID=147567 RepID=A0A9P4MYQ9_9PLEO|nr:epoxide hydrolase-like protein [Didymosphaeria enalia]